MYMDRSLVGDCKVVTPIEVILNNDVKQLLPIYLVLYIRTGQFDVEEFQSSTSIKELCYLTKTINTNHLRSAQYSVVIDALGWLVENGYLVVYDYVSTDVNRKFRYKFVDDLYERIKQSQESWKQRYLSIDVAELCYMMRAIGTLDNSDKVLVSVVRVYLYMRFLTGVWQTTYEDKMPAYCGCLSWVDNAIKMNPRTFDRVVALLKGCGLITVTHRNNNTVGADNDKPTIVVFNALCRDKTPWAVTLDVEQRLTGAAGKESGYYPPGKDASDYADEEKPQPDDQLTVTPEVNPPESEEVLAVVESVEPPPADEDTVDVPPTPEEPATEETDPLVKKCEGPDYDPSKSPYSAILDHEFPWWLDHTEEEELKAMEFLRPGSVSQFLEKENGTKREINPDSMF